jgi:hypothetical protein
MRIASLLVLALAFTACKSKSKPEDKPEVASGTAVVTPPPAVDAAAAAAPPAEAVDAKFGCLGWSPASKVAACVTGETAMGEDPKFQVVFLGGSEPVAKLADAKATITKLGIQPFASPAKEVKLPGKTDLGGGASMVWTSKVTNKGGPNIAPTTKHEVVVTCANKQKAELVKSEEEGSEPALMVWSVPDHVVIEVNTHVGREGESSDTREAMLLELATCKLTKPPA